MSSYRDEQLANVEKVRLKRLEAVEVFLDRSQPTAKRLSAAPSCGTFLGEEEVNRAAQVFADPSQDSNIRAAALNGLSNELTEDESLVARVIGTLEDAGEPAVLRLMALTSLQASEFASVALPRLRPRYMNALRGLLQDGVAALRTAAAERLALERDAFLQDLLVKGLEAPSLAMFPPERAIQYLANDLHAEWLPLLRQIAEHPPNPAAKKEALRNLATDPASRDLLAATVLDKSEHPEIRHVCLVGLFRTDVAFAMTLAKQVVDDSDADEELRAAILNTMTHLGQTRPGDRDGEFDERVAKLGVESESAPLKRMAQSYTARGRT